MYKDKQKMYDQYNKWKKENTYRFQVQFMLDRDKEIIEALKKCDNKVGLVREALKEYLKK